MPATSNGLLFVQSGALVRRVGGSTTEVANLLEGWSCRATGVLQEALWAAIEGAESTPVLAALGEDHPLSRIVSRLKGEAGRLLSPGQAVMLDGFDTLFVELTGQCNERCVHCYAESHPGLSAHLDRSTCEGVLQDAAALGFRRVQFTGGDPLLCDFLPALVERVRALDIPGCEIYTNGLLLHQPLLERLRPFWPAFAFSFYSSDAGCHDAITRTPGSQQRTARAIRRALEAGLQVRVSIIVMEQNAHTVDETIAYLRELGVRDVGASGTRAVGRGGLYRGALGTPRADEHVSQPEPSAEGEPWRSGKLCVTYEGLVVPCIFNRKDVLGDLGRRRLREITAAPRPPVDDGLGGDELIASCCDRLQCKSCQLTAYALRAAGGPSEAPG